MNLLLTRWRNKLSGPIGHFLIDDQPGDVFIAAFPRSGSTWLRTMISVVRYPDRNLAPDLYNENMPAVSIRNAVKIRRLDGPRLIMTHALWRPSVQKAVYVVRDGRDVLVSYYHYLITRQGKSMNFNVFLRHYEQEAFGPTWERHLMSWLGHAKAILNERLLVLRFEDLKNNPEGSLENVCIFLGLHPDASLLKMAIEKASVANMRKLEAKTGQGFNADASFYRGGRIGQWRAYFDKSMLIEFERRAGEAMKQAGYR